MDLRADWQIHKNTVLQVILFRKTWWAISQKTGHEARCWKLHTANSTAVIVTPETLVIEPHVRKWHWHPANDVGGTIGKDADATARC